MKAKETFLKWLDGDFDLLAHVADTDEHPDPGRAELKREKRHINRRIDSSKAEHRVERAEEKGFYALYTLVAVVSCVFLIGILLFTISYLPRYGVENPETTEVVRRYVENGLEETGAVNIVAGMILDYRAFDTLGESHVLFTALICVTILLRIDNKNMQSRYEDYFKIRMERYHELTGESIAKIVGMVLIPSIFLYGIYVLLNGQNGPGGGFSGGTVMGVGLIIFAATYGFDRVDRVFTAKRLNLLTFCALGFYSFAKGYVFFMGQNGYENHIPKGTPGAILSGGLILPLDIAVGLVVACTMFGFYSLFRRGSIGGGWKSDREL